MQSDVTRLDGVAIGVLMGFSAEQEPLIVFAGNRADTAIPARTTVALTAADIGREVALLFEGGDPSRPLVIGRILREMQPPPPTLEVLRDGERLELTAEREIVLRCGKASVTLTRAGKVLIQGAYVSSRSSGMQRLTGASVHIN